jgi:hypothetical protein
MVSQRGPSMSSTRVSHRTADDGVVRSHMVDSSRRDMSHRDTTGNSTRERAISTNPLGERTFGEHQRAIAAKRILELSEGKAGATFLEKLEGIRTGHKTKHTSDQVIAHVRERAETRSTHRSTAMASLREEAEAAEAAEAVAEPRGKNGLEGYNFDADESRVHFEMRSEMHRSRHELAVLRQTIGFVVIIGLLLVRDRCTNSPSFAHATARRATPPPIAAHSAVAHLPISPPRCAGLHLCGDHVLRRTSHHRSQHSRLPIIR